MGERTEDKEEGEGEVWGEREKKMGGLEERGKREVTKSVERKDEEEGKSSVKWGKNVGR